VVYRLVFCDLDGTVATYQHQVRPAVRGAMQAVAGAGTWITISTGRGYQTLKPFLDLLVVNAPLICCNGGLVVDPLTLEVLDAQPMSLSLAKDLVSIAPAANLDMWFYLDDLQTILAYSAESGSFALHRDGSTQEAVRDPLSVLERPPHKVVIFSPSPQDTSSAVERVQRYVGTTARVLASGPRTIEVIAPGISKAGALSFVAAHLGVSRDETLAIGDGNNDVEMLEWAGLGVAMGNAIPEVKAVAAWTAPSVDEDGAAVALQRFVLQG